jgi:Fic family protein
MLGIENIKITHEDLIQIGKIDSFKGLWAGLDRHTTGLNMLREVADYGANLQRVLKPLKARTLTPEIVRLVHAMQNPKAAGASELPSFKTAENDLDIFDDVGRLVGSLATAPPDQVGPLLDKLLKWMNEALVTQNQHPLILAAVFTAVFLQISPFEHGNHKTALFLAVLIMLKADYAYAPFAPLDKILLERAQDYFDALSHQQQSLEQGRADWARWLGFFLSLLGTQTQILHARLEDKNKDLSHLPTLSGRILNLFEDHERLQMNDIIDLTNGRRSTIKLRIGELTKQGYLRRYGQARNTWYAVA